MSRSLRFLLFAFITGFGLVVTGCSSNPTPVPTSAAPTKSSVVDPAANPASTCTHLEVDGNVAVPSAVRIVCDDGTVIDLDPVPVEGADETVFRKPLGDHEHQVRSYLSTESGQLRVWWGPVRQEKNTEGIVNMSTVSFWDLHDLSKAALVLNPYKG